jgi:hypothetical protein
MTTSRGFLRLGFLWNKKNRNVKPRPDIIIVGTGKPGTQPGTWCTDGYIYEIKPNNARQIKRGTKQICDYMRIQHSSDITVYNNGTHPGTSGDDVVAGCGYLVWARWSDSLDHGTRRFYDWFPFNYGEVAKCGTDRLIW